jgi:uncharacterized protein YunC (DUF1805 family)
MAKLKEVSRDQVVAYQSAHGRIIVMDSITFSDERNNTGDVLIGASFCGILAVQFALRVDPKGVICHDAGVGKDLAGINALWALDGRRIPGGAAAAMSARLGDGKSLYEEGILSFINESATDLGIEVGMRVKDAAMKMLHWKRPIIDVRRPKEIVYRSKNGSIVATGSVSFITPDNTGDVICAGSHFGVTSSAYSCRFNLRGVICNDGGIAKDKSGIAGLDVAERKGIPAAAVATDSARIGDGMSTYHDGIISALNKPAKRLGIGIGMKAKDAAMIMLRR